MLQKYLFGKRYVYMENAFCRAHLGKIDKGSAEVRLGNVGDRQLISKNLASSTAKLKLRTLFNSFLRG